MGLPLKEFVTPVRKEIDLHALQGKVVGIDTYNYLYAYLMAIRASGRALEFDGRVTSHLNGFFYKIIEMLKFDIRPVFVVEGEKIEEKKEELEKRRQFRDEAKTKAAKAFMDGNIKQYNKYMAMCETITPEMITDFKRLVRAFGLPFLTAGSEAEAQIAYMNRKEDVWGTATQDYDALLFGAKRMVRNLLRNKTMKIHGKEIILNKEVINLPRLLDHHKITQEQLIDIGILNGTDFNKGVDGVGIKTALKYIKKYGNAEGVIDNVEKVSDQIKIEEIDQIRKIYSKPKVETEYKLEFTLPNMKKVAFLMVKKFGFNFDRVVSAIKGLKKSNIYVKRLI